MFKLTSVAGACALALASAQARAADDRLAQAATTDTPTVAAPAPDASAATANAPTATQLNRVNITGVRDRLDAARNSLSPETGSSIYRFDKADIQKLPLGEDTALNQVLLQAPGVVQDSFGQLFVRGDHANLQYRINGVVIPESITGFGPVLDTRFASQINLLTGALPAQYGYRTAGVVDIRTRGPGVENSGSVGFLLGTRGYREPSFTLGGSAGDLQYFFTGSYVENQLGIENPTGSRNAVHDNTYQGKGFAYLSYLLGNDSRISLILGSAQNSFQIPNVAGQTPQYDVAGVTVPNSINLNAAQRERNNYQVLSFQSSFNDGTAYQISLFNRISSVHYIPDPIGDLAYNGVAGNVARRDTAYGLQLDASKQLGADHTLRAGIFLQRERSTVDNLAVVFPADDQGNQTSNVPIEIPNNNRISGHLYGIYAQDEWQLTKALTINYGLRYDSVTTVSDEHQWSPRIGAVYQLTPDTRVHAGYARYFTPPPAERIDGTSVQAFLGTTNALPSDANTNVKSERSNYYDLGISHQLTPKITIGADAYYRQVGHLQDEGQFGNSLIFSAFNYSKGKIYGLELTGSYRDDRFTAYTNLAFTSDRGQNIETGQFNFGADELAFISNNFVHLDHEQKFTASAGASYRFGDKTVVGSDLVYGSGLRNGFANIDHLPGYIQVNSSVSQGFDLQSVGKFDIRFSVINLFDRSYQLRDGSGIGVGAPQFGPRRTFYVAFNKPFTF